MAMLVLSSAWAQGGQTRFEVDSGLLPEVLKAFAAAHPAYTTRFLDDSGEPRTYYNIYINDLDVPRADRATATVAEGDVITILPPLAGG